MTQKTVTTKPSTPRIGFVNDVLAELKKVIWLTRNEAFRLTVMVVIICIAAAAVLGLIDLGFTRLVDFAFIG